MAAVAPILGLVASTLALLGILGAYLGLVAPMVGFGTFVGGALLGGLLTVVVSLVGVLQSRAAQDPQARLRSLVGLAVGLGLLLVVLGAASTGGDAPPINDITTDLENPPAFASPSVVPDFEGRDMSYPAEFVPIVRESYPDLAPLRLDSPVPRTFARAIEAAEGLGWEIVARDPARGVFEARDVTSIFRFVDDVTVRIVADGAGSKVDVRSKSRDGRGDLGANAARIHAFLAALGGQG